MRAAALAGGVLVVSALTAAPALAAPADLDPFGIAGSPADGLYPGSSGSIDLTLTNPNDVALTLQELTVSILSIAQAPGAVGPCATADFEVAQLPAAADVVLPPHSATMLSSLGVAAADLPRFGMVDTGVVQDGCKGATVTLLFEGTAIAPEVGGVDQPPVPGGGTGTGGGQGPTGPGDVGGVDLPGTGASHTTDLLVLGAGLVLAGSATVVTFRRRRSGT